MKYIVDIPSELVLKDDGYSFSDGNSYCITGNLSKLTPYAEPDRNVIEDEVWEFVKKIECLTVGETEDCFDVEYEGIPFVANMFSYQEAKARYEAWKKQKDEIHVGDEYSDVGEVFVVTNINNSDIASVIFTDGSVDEFSKKELRECRKTGRHFPEVAELLEKMRGE